MQIEPPLAAFSPHRWLTVRLSTMMLLEFIVFGAWFATLGLVLATHGFAAIIGQAYFLSAIAAIVSPLMFGAIGDRLLAPRTVLAIAHGLGGAVMLVLRNAISGGNGPLLLVLIFFYMLVFNPTLGLVNAISLDLLRGREHRFPFVRVFGPVGWVLAGVGVGYLGLSASGDVFAIAGVAELALAAYSLTLPWTRPPAAGVGFSLGDLIGIHAFVLFRDRNFAVLMVCCLFTAISLGVYNTYSAMYLSAIGIANVAGTLALGQASEVAFIVTIPWVLPKLGVKWALLLGMGMWAVRFALFIAAASGPAALAVAGVALHGICNDYFIIIAAMFIARMAPVELAAQAQGWLILMISGFGSALGAAISSNIFATRVLPHQADGAIAWVPLWLVPLVLAAITCVIWIALFRPDHAPMENGNGAPCSTII